MKKNAITVSYEYNAQDKLGDLLVGYTKDGRILIEIANRKGGVQLRLFLSSKGAGKLCNLLNTLTNNDEED